MAFRVIRPEELVWETRPHGPEEPARRVAEVGEAAGLRWSRGNMWRYEPGAKGRRHRHKSQEETFVVLSGALTMYLGDPPERHEVAAGGVVHVDPGTPLQAANHGDDELVVWAYGWPGEDENAELLDPAAG
jgi:quercetin dioxygenase-like cupin family protein